MKSKITKRLVDSLRAEIANGGLSADRTVFDSVDLGFVLRMRKSASMSYAVEYKASRGRGARTRRVTIARVGKINLLSRPREAARKVLGSVAHGEDPAAEKVRQRRSLLLSDVIENFLTQHAEAKRKPSSAAWMRDALERVVKPALGNMKPDAVMRADIARFHSSMNVRQLGSSPGPPPRRRRLCHVLAARLPCGLVADADTPMVASG
jgi:hypothetical protein